MEVDFPVGVQDVTSQGFKLTEGGTGFGKASIVDVYAGEYATKGVSRGVPGVYEDAGTTGNVAKKEFLETMTGAVMVAEPVSGKWDGGVGGVVEDVLGRIVGWLNGFDTEAIMVEHCADSPVGIKFFTDEYEGVEVGLHGVKDLKVWSGCFYCLFIFR